MKKKVKYLVVIALFIISIFISIFIYFDSITKFLFSLDPIVITVIFSVAIIIIMILFFRKLNIPLPHQYYKKLDGNIKIQFWTVTSSCFVAVFTFWWGIVLQFLAIDSTKEVNGRLTNVQYVNEVYPSYKEYTDSCELMTEKLLSLFQSSYDKYENDMSDKKDINLKIRISSILLENESDMKRLSFLTDSIFDKSKFYLSSDSLKKFEFNSLLARVGLCLLEIKSDPITEKIINETVAKMFSGQKNGLLLLVGENKQKIIDKFVKTIHSKVKEKNYADFYLSVSLKLVIEPLLENRRMIINLMYDKPKATNSAYIITLSFIIMLIIGYVLWTIISYFAIFKNRTRQ